MPKVLIIGGGQAGFQVADSLTKVEGGPHVVLLCGKRHLPYQRPPLSKKHLAGKISEKRLFFRPYDFYERRGINVITGVTVTSVNSELKIVTTDQGDSFSYDTLVFATGARVREFPNSRELGLKYIRGIDDIAAIREGLEAAESVILIGGGFIGLEAAATIKELGKSVTVIEAMPHLMPNLIAPILSDYYRKTHEEKGVTVITGAKVSGIQKENDCYSVALEDGRSARADMVIVGIGVIPNTELAESIGLATERGILVDENGRTQNPDIYAVGDCAHGMHMLFGARTRLESVQNAVDQSIAVASHILGDPKPYSSLPWFWSDQYELKLQMAGLSRGFEDYVVRGDMASGKFSICYFKGGTLIAVDSISKPADHLAAKRLIEGGISPTRDQCKKDEISLKSLLK